MFVKDGTIKIATLFTGIGIIGWSSYLLALKRAASNIQIETNLNVDASFEGLQIHSDPIIKNPTRFSFEISHPFVNLLLKKSDGKTTSIGSSNPRNQFYTIPSAGSVSLDRITINVNWRNLPILLQEARKGKIEIVTETMLNVTLQKLFNMRLPITDKQTHSIDTSKISHWLTSIF